jgi:CubicO group peptidase (beta-lactamase class C family)
MSRKSFFSGWRVRSMVLVIAVIILFEVLQLRSAAHPAPSSLTSDYGAVDSYVAANAHDLAVPGLSFGLVHGTQIVDLKGYGLADESGRGVTSQTPFVIGSVSKSFTALAIMQLVEAGRLDLDASVQRYLPWFRVADPAASAQMTVRQLLNQTSGISTETGNTMLVQRAADIEAVVRGLATAKLTAAPGTLWQYSNANYEILGLLVQMGSGQSYADYVQQHIFAPLDMQHSYVAKDAALQHGLGTGHRLWFGLPVAEPPDLRSEFTPAGYLVSTAEDLSHYLVAQLNGGRYGSASVLSPSGIQEMQRAAVPQRGLSSGQSYGMGWMQGFIDGEQLVYHEGITNDMFATLLMIPRLNYGLVLLTNGQSLLYVLLQRQELIAFNLARMLMGHRVNGSLSGLYPVFDLLALALIVLQSRTIFRLLRRTDSVLDCVGEAKSR